jgi:2-dehydro-3-deoxygalactonokinase
MSSLFIAGDWGTSRLRLALCDGDRVIDRKAGPGAVGAGIKHEDVLFELIQSWLAEHDAVPVLLCGMVGSRNGWVEAPYAPCPADVDDLRRLLVRFEARGAAIAIVPGLSGVSPRSAPDVMRGEETQIIGALADHPELASGSHLLALPGTHTKWVRVEEGRIVTFQTALTGEMFALLRDHSTLAKAGGAAAGAAGGGFAAGLARHAQRPAGGLLQEFFEVRSRQLLDGWTPAYALDFLSGLLIAADVEGARALIGAPDQRVVMIGEEQLNERYSQALNRLGVASRALSGEACALSGLRAIFQPSTQGAPHALAR